MRCAVVRVRDPQVLRGGDHELSRQGFARHARHREGAPEHPGERGFVGHRGDRVRVQPRRRQLRGALQLAVEDVGRVAAGHDGLVQVRGRRYFRLSGIYWPCRRMKTRKVKSDAVYLPFSDIISEEV